MKKILYFTFALFMGFAIAACSDKKDQSKDSENKEAAENVEEKTDDQTAEDVEKKADFDQAAEDAVVAYEDYFVKYDDLMTRSEAGEDIFDELMALQESVYEISEQLITTESKRNDDQNARVKAVEDKINAWKQKLGLI